MPKKPNPSTHERRLQVGKKIASEYVDDRTSIEQLARKYFYSPRYIRLCLVAAGVTIRQRGRNKQVEETLKKAKEAKRLYLEKKMTCKELGEHFNRHHTTIYEWLGKVETPTRSRAEHLRRFNK